MVAVLVIPDGAAEPIGDAAPHAPAGDPGRAADARAGHPASPPATTLEAARTPVLDALAAEGDVVRVAVTPPHLPAGSETGVPALLGHVADAPLSRGWVDAAAYGIAVPAGMTPRRADVLRADGTRASGVETRTAAAALGPTAVWTRGHRLLLLTPADDAPSTPEAAFGDLNAVVPFTSPNAPLRWCDGGLQLRVWPDGATLPRTLRLATAVIAGPGAAAGCARLLGADVLVPETATGDVGTDLAAKARAARAAIMRGATTVVVHVGGPDEASHRRDRTAKRAALEALDRELLAPLRAAVRAAGGTLAVCPDHTTDPATGAHGAEPVPALRWGPGIAAAGPDRLTERATAGRPARAPHWPLRGVRAPVESSA